MTAPPARARAAATLAGMDLMAPLIAQDPGSPRITTYTAAGRMELSAATADNWAAKVANLLAATGVGRGDAVAVLASTGWMPLVVTLGCWRIGATVTDGSGAGAGERVGVVVTDDLPGIGGDLEDADEILLLSSDPFGRGVAESGGEVPFGVTDMAPELRVQPDAFLGAEATGGVLYRGLSPAGGRVEVTEEHLRREAGAVVAQLGDAPRVVVPGWDDAATMTRRLLPLVVGGSVVVVDDAAAELDAVAETERGRVADLG